MFASSEHSLYFCSTKIYKGHDAAAPNKGCLFCVTEERQTKVATACGSGNTHKGNPL